MAETPVPVCPDPSWFVHDRFGLFIHWGLYALPGRHEWVKHRERITTEDYQKYFDHFEPDLYDPTIWAKAAAGAGMKYFVITTKHHEGFCLWDSALTEYKVTRTPWGRCLLGPMVDAFRAEGLKVGFYHSLIDWYHTQFPVDRVHPQRDDAAFREREKGRDVRLYADYLYGQTAELIDRWRPEIMWFDFSYPGEDGKGAADWQSERLLRMVREKAPNIIVNNRTEVAQDLWTPEQFQPRAWVEVDGRRVMWEACQTLNGSWGYDRDNRDWKSVGMLLRMLIDGVSKGGNLLLNVGPTARGEFDAQALATLADLGAWMRRHGRSIYGCTQWDGPPPPEDCRFTYNPATGRLYLHLFAWPFGAVHLDGFADRVAYAQLLGDASEIRMTANDPHWRQPGADNVLTLRLPIQPPPVEIPVIELYLK